MDGVKMKIGSVERTYPKALEGQLRLGSHVVKVLVSQLLHSSRPSHLVLSFPHTGVSLLRYQQDSDGWQGRTYPDVAARSLAGLENSRAMDRACCRCEGQLAVQMRRKAYPFPWLHLLSPIR